MTNGIETNLNNALNRVKGKLLSAPIDVALDALKEAAKEAEEADSPYAEALARLVDEMETAYETYDRVEHEFLDLFFPEG
jgi:hypothetical protein